MVRLDAMDVVDDEARDNIWGQAFSKQVEHQLLISNCKGTSLQEQFCSLVEYVRTLSRANLFDRHHGFLRLAISNILVVVVRINCEPVLYASILHLIKVHQEN